MFDAATIREMALEEGFEPSCTSRAGKTFSMPLSRQLLQPWLSRQDLNLRRIALEATALTRLSYGRKRNHLSSGNPFVIDFAALRSIGPMPTAVTIGCPSKCGSMT